VNPAACTKALSMLRQPMNCLFWLYQKLGNIDQFILNCSPFLLLMKTNAWLLSLLVIF